MRSPKALAQEPYHRARENPFFDGLLRGDGAQKNKNLPAGGQNIFRSQSDISDGRSKKFITNVSEKSIDLALEDSPSDIVLEPLGHSTCERVTKITKTTSFQMPCVQLQSDWSFILGDANDGVKESSPKASQAIVEYKMPVLPRPVIEKSYIVNKTKRNMSRIPLPQSAASFYNGLFPQVEIVESCESIMRLNLYLKSRRDDVNAGVPGRFLHAVIGQDVSDVGSIVSTIMYGFYLNETIENDQLCTVPVINMKRTDLSSHSELKWLLDLCQIEESSLIFVDEIDLSYYDLFGGLKLVLLNGNKLPTKQEALKEAVVEIFNCRKGESVYPGVQTLTIREDSSCCTLIAEKFALTSPEVLSGQGFSKLLLAGILLDTGNLTSTHCTTKDKYMATLLINGAGRFGMNGFYQILRHKMYDISDIKIIDVLRKDFKKWTRVGKPESAGSRFMVSNIGMSSIGISIEQLLAHDDYSIEEIKYFQQLEKLRLLTIVSGYYDPQKNFKREVLISTESVELMKNLIFFFNSNASELSLKALHQPGLREEMKVFQIDKVTSRKTIERLLEEFSIASKG